MLLNLLPFSAAFSGISFLIGGYHVRLEQILSCVLFAILINRVLLTNKLYLDAISKLIIIVLSLHILSSLVSAPDIKFSLLQTFSLMSVWFIYIILTNFLDNKPKIEKFVKYYLISGFLEILYGIILYIAASYLGHNLPGANVFREPGVVEALGIQGTQVEPNIFGSYCLPYLLISITLLCFINRNKLHNRFFLLLLLISSMSGMIMSFTRGAWLGGIVGLVLIVILNQITSHKVTRKYGYQLLLVTILTIAAFISAKEYFPESFFTHKIDHFLSTDEGDAAQRLWLWDEAMDNVKRNPILGNGTYSFASIDNPLGFYGRSEKAWIGNVFLTILHDSGIIGLLVFIILCLNIFITGVKAITVLNRYDIIMSYFTLGLVASFGALLVSFIFSMASSTAYPWIAIGLIGAINRYIRNHVDSRHPN